jgi:bacterioferritin-associated ferredoxin
MIVCSCNIISRRDIEAAVEEILAEDSYAVVTPGLVYHRLGKRGKCGGCFPHAVRILVEHGDTVRARLETGEGAAAAGDESGSEPIYGRAVAAE